MKKKEFNKIKDDYYNKDVIIITYDNEEIIGKYDLEHKDLGVIEVGNKQIFIKDIKSIRIFKDNKIYKYVLVTYIDEDDITPYSYRTTIKDIRVGDTVLVDRLGSKVYAKVSDVGLFTRDSVPYPVEETKEVISVINHEDSTNKNNNATSNDSSKRITVDSDGFRYNLTVMERQVYAKLRELGFNLKQSFRIILLLRTNFNSDKCCERMFSFLNSNSDILEIEKYAILLANEENYEKYRMVCPYDNNLISMLECLKISDEDDWKDEGSSFKTVCKKCKWHNPFILDNSSFYDVPIIFTGLTEKIVKNLNYDDVIAISIAESGAMGIAGNLELVVATNNKLIGYQTNPLLGGIPYFKLYKVIPWLQDFRCDIDGVYNVLEGWKHIDTGFGNHLLVRKGIYERLKPKMKDKSAMEIYKFWKKWLASLGNYEEYRNDINRMKPKKQNESIYAFINRNITSTGCLPSDFSLRYFKYSDDERFYFTDGMIDYLFESEIDKDILEKLQNLIELLEDNTIVWASCIVDEYYTLNKDKYILGTLDIFLEWARDNAQKYNNNLIFQWAIYLVMYSKKVETVKIGIALLGLFNLEKEFSIIEILETLALSDEFASYVDVALSNLENINDIRFDLVKRLSGYGKISLISKLEVTSLKIGKWLFRYGCKNDIDNCYNALNIALKLDLPKIIKETKFSKDDLDGLYNIIEGLMHEYNHQGFSKYKDKDKLFSAIIAKEDELINELEYIYILCLIKNYLEEENKDSLYIASINEILNADKVVDVIKDNIKTGKFLEDILYIVDNIDSLNIYDFVYEVFKKNLSKGYKNEAISLLSYLLKNKDYFYDILDLLRTNFDFSSSLGAPETVIDTNDMSLESIIRELVSYPMEGVDFVLSGLKCKSMSPRNASLDVLKKWTQSQDKKVKKYLPKVLYEALLELREKEVIKAHREKINEILGIKEDLSKFKEEKVRLVLDREVGNDKKINLFYYDMNNLFLERIIRRGEEYFENDMVFNVIKQADNYIGYVQGSNYDDEYEVLIKVDDDNNILEISCTCPYEGNCKHEYAVILYIRNNL